MLLKLYNRALIRDTEKTYLTVACAAAATTLTVADTSLNAAGTASNIWSDNTYLCLGEIGQEGTEVLQINGAVTSATSLTVDREGANGARFAHPIGTPVYKIDYNQACFYHNTDDTTSGASLLSTENLQLDKEFTPYDDTGNDTGYGFVRFKNSTATAYSAYSDGVNYEESGESSSRDPRTLWSLRKKVRQLLDENREDSKLTDAMIDDAINDKQREIAHMRLWSFYEGERSFSSVENQFAHDLPSTVNKVHGCTFETQPLNFINRTEWEMRHFDTDDSTTDPFNFTIWNNQIKLHPRPSSDASTDTLDGDITSSATSLVVASATTFKRGDYYRFIIDDEVIYATGYDSDTLTFSGLLRGREGTTAAAHTDTTTITERNIVYTCHVEPTNLLNTQERTSIPEPEVLIYGVVIDLAPYVGKENIISLYEPKYNIRIKDLKDKYSSKQTMQFGRIKDMSERPNLTEGFINPNNYPKNLS